MPCRPRHRRLAAAAALFIVAFAACDPCEDLEAKICQDLGADDCAIWASPPVDKAGIGSETMTSESCANTQTGPTYERMVSAARTAVEDRKRAIERERNPP